MMVGHTTSMDHSFEVSTALAKSRSLTKNIITTIDTRLRTSLFSLKVLFLVQLSKRLKMISLGNKNS